MDIRRLVREHESTVKMSYLDKFERKTDDFVEKINLCPYCVCHSQHVDGFLRVCTKRPHLLVWAKYINFPYWPAKVLRYDKASDCFECQFFDTNKTYGLVKVDKCYRLTKEFFKLFPDARRSKQIKQLRAALKLLNTHVALLRCQYPTQFRYSEGKTNCDVNNLFMCDPKVKEEVRELNFSGNPNGKVAVTYTQSSLIAYIIIFRKAREDAAS